MNSEMSLISVATPSNPDFTPDLTAVDEVIRTIGSVLRNKTGPHVIVLRSTVPPGTTVKRILPILLESSGVKLVKGCHWYSILNFYGRLVGQGFSQSTPNGGW